MPAYRFCRTDDIQLLTDAVNACYVVHFPDEAALSSSDFKRDVRELDVWCSSCMVASADGDPIAVVIGAKRAHETLIHRIAVRPGFMRRGHAQHMLQSLGQKLAVLGPPLIVAEVPDDLSGAPELFGSLGYEAGARFADFRLSKPLAPSPAAGEVSETGLDELLRYGAIDPSVTRSWERALETLRNRKDQLRGVAIASDTRVEAHALYRDVTEEGRREIVAIGAADQGEEGRLDSRLLAEVVLRVACQAGSLVVTIPKVSTEEIAWSFLESMGFEQVRTYTRYCAAPDSRTR
ncbi:MAG: GNAT family N-acetyltransferase [Acidobacteria bacterium]|nr:GNAT family N-acetyltransferase [Acidobacteriota bacterium]